MKLRLSVDATLLEHANEIVPARLFDENILATLTRMAVQLRCLPVSFITAASASFTAGLFRYGHDSCGCSDVRSEDKLDKVTQQLRAIWSTS
jgi:hypothetical protein